tara:strand:+ start:515 stop:781 length:267 start_codon:yes stop_codon:yes gene_type:complete
MLMLIMASYKQNKVEVKLAADADDDWRRTFMGLSWELTPLSITALVESFSVLTPTKWAGGAENLMSPVAVPSCGAVMNCCGEIEPDVL